MAAKNYIDAGTHLGDLLGKSIERIADKKYRIKYSLPTNDTKVRKQRTETLSNVTKVEAEAILAERKRIVVQGKDPVRFDDRSLTISELFRRFMVAKKTIHEANTKDRYHSLYRTYLEPELGEKTIASLAKSDLVNAYAAWEDRNGRKPSGRTLRHAHDLNRSILNWAVSMDFLDRNIALKMTTHDLPKAKKPALRCLDDRELIKLLEEAQAPTSRAKCRGTLSAEAWFYAAVMFAAYTGARRGEILAVRWAALDFDHVVADGSPEPLVTIRESLEESDSGLAFKTPKNDRSRDVSLPAGLVNVLRTHRAAQLAERSAMGPAYRDQDLVFARPDGSCVAPWNFGASFKDLVLRAEVRTITLHDLRDTHASLLMTAGVNIETISKRLGHSSISITYDRYITIFRSADVAAARAFQLLVT